MDFAQTALDLAVRGWNIGSALTVRLVNIVWPWLVSVAPADYRPFMNDMAPGIAIIGLGVVVCALEMVTGGRSKKAGKAAKQTSTNAAAADKYAPRMGTPWHCWFWPLFGQTWVVPLAAGWWPRWKWLEEPIKVFKWEINVSYQANWFMHTVLFKIPGLAWRLKLAVVAHIGIIGGTGQGKDAILQWVIEHVHDRAVGGVWLDKSWPSELAMRRAGGVIIKPNGNVRWNMLAGEGRFAAERSSRWNRIPEQDTGSTRGAYRDRVEAYCRVTPSNQRYIGPPVDDGGQGLLAWIQTSPKFTGQDHWINRLRDMHMALGMTDGPNGVDISELIARKEKFGFFFDTFRMVSVVGALGVAAILDIMRASADIGDLRDGVTGDLPEDLLMEFEDVKGLRGAYIILNEGGSLEKRTQELDLFLKAARARDCRVWAAVQNAAHFGGVLTANINQWILFATGDNDAKKWHSATLDGRVPPEAFSSTARGLRKLECFIACEGRLQRVRIQPPDMRKPSKGVKVANVRASVNCSGEPRRNPGVVVVMKNGDTGRAKRGVHRTRETVLVAGHRPKMLKGPELVRSYVRGRADRERIWKKLVGTWNRQGCHAWGSKSRNRAYGKTSYLGRSGWSPHFLMWAWRLMQDAADLTRFLELHPQVQAFRWPEGIEVSDRDALLEYEKEFGLRLSLSSELERKLRDGETQDSDQELIRLLALQAWMRRWDLHLDHRCPGRPNPLCANAGECGEPIQWAHIWLTTREENLELRWLRERGDVRETAPDFLAEEVA